MLPLVLTYALVIVLAYQGAGLAWKLVDAFSEADINGVRLESVPANPQGGSAPAPVSVVWKELMLFGPEPDPSRVVAAAEVAKPKPAPKPPSEPVRVTLYGTISSTDPANSLAVLAGKSGKADIYRVGDEIQTGVTLSEVRQRSAVLSVGDAEQEVWLVEDGQGRTSAAPPPVASVNAARAGGKALETRVTEPEVIRKLDNYRNELADNPLSLVDKVRVFVVQRNGQAYGVRVRPGTDRELLGQLGLRSGDILLTLNGVPLNDVTRLADVIAQLKENRDLTVDVERGGRRQELRLVMENTGAN